MITEAVLTSDKVNALIKACLPEERRDPSELKMAEGVVVTYGFDPERLEEHRPHIEALIRELPSAFLVGPGGGAGYSFLGMCEDRHARQWTGLHSEMEALMCLALGIDKAEYCLPREMWAVLPSGLPYIRFKQ